MWLRMNSAYMFNTLEFFYAETEELKLLFAFKTNNEQKLEEEIII